jgi:hypothetical protein
MLSKNNWLTTNLGQRLINPNIDLEVSLNPYDFTPVGFIEASEIAAKEIADNYDNIYIGITGGLDSEYITRLFHRLKIPFTPLLISCGNTKESSYAYAVFKELAITPEIITVTEEDFKRYFYDYIYTKLNSIGWHGTQALIAAEYVGKKQGLLLLGNHLIGDYPNTTDEGAHSVDWDFYCYHIFPNTNVTNFFLYTPQLAYSMLPRDIQPIDWAIYKSQLYGVEHRYKIRPFHSQETRDWYKDLIDKMEYKPATKFSWTKEQIQNIFGPHLKNNL